MNEKLIITNRTDRPMQAIITDNYTGNNVMQCELQPGFNELYMNSLLTGTYIIHLEDANQQVFYEQKIFRD